MIESKQSKCVVSDFRIEKLNESHLNIIQKFESYEQDLVDFLIEDAFDNQEKNISTTYLWFDKRSDKLISYITLLADAISLTRGLKDEFISKNVFYKSLPAIKIGRLCVSDNYLRKGIGSLMIKFAMYKVMKINETIGCRFLTLDAIRNDDIRKDSLHFYKKIGFEVLRERQKGTIPMYRDLYYLIEEYKKII
jgi:GNAT superfamily N-acetyltransferase